MSGINLYSSEQQANVANTAAASTSEDRLALPADTLKEKLQLVIAKSKSYPYGVNEGIPDLDGLSVVAFLESYLASDVQKLSELTDQSSNIRCKITYAEERLSQANATNHPKDSTPKSPAQKIRYFTEPIPRLFGNKTLLTTASISPKGENPSLHPVNLEELNKQITDIDRKISQLLVQTDHKIMEILSGARFYISTDAEDRTLLEALLIRSGDIRPHGISYPDQDFLEIRDPTKNHEEVDTEVNILGDTIPEFGQQSLHADKENVLFEDNSSPGQQFRSVFSPDEIPEDGGLAARFLVERLLARGVKVDVDQHTSRSGKLFIEVAGFCYLLEPIAGYVPRGIWTVTEWDKSAPDKGSVPNRVTPESAELGTNLLLKEVDRLLSEYGGHKRSAAIGKIRERDTRHIIDGGNELSQIFDEISANSISSRVTAAGGKILRLSDPDTDNPHLNQEIYIAYTNFTVLISRDVDSSVERDSEDSDTKTKWPSWSIQVTKDSEARFDLFDQLHVNKRNLKPTIEWILDEIELQEKRISR